MAEILGFAVTYSILVRFSRFLRHLKGFAEHYILSNRFLEKSENIYEKMKKKNCNFLNIRVTSLKFIPLESLTLADVKYISYFDIQQDLVEI